MKLLLKTLQSAKSNSNLMSLAGNMVVSVMGIISVSLLFRSLGVKEIGIWIFFISTMALVETFRAGFITTAFIKFYSGASKARASEVVGSTWVLSLCITATFLTFNLIAYLLPLPFSNESLSLFIKWFGFAFLLTLPSFIASTILQADQRFDKILYIRLINQGSFILFIICLIIGNRINLTNIFYAYLLSLGITSATVLFLRWTKPGLIKYKSKRCIKEIFQFGKFSVGTNIGCNLLFHSDTLLITFLLGPAALAVFNLAKRFMEIVEMPLRSFVATAMASLSYAYNHGDHQEANKILKKYAGILTWALAPVIVITIIFAEIPISLIGGGKYVGTESANLLRILMIISILSPLDRFIAVTTDVMNKPVINFIKIFLMLALSVAGNYIGIYFLGDIYGVALASIPTNLIGFFFGYYLFKKYFPIPVALPDIIKYGYEEFTLLIRQILLKTKTRLKPVKG